MQAIYVIGVDYGTDSVRSVIINTSTGEELAHSTFFYPRWKAGLYCNATKNQYRQHPLDYLEGLVTTVRDCVNQVGPTVRSRIKSIGIDTTGSSPCPVDHQGTPLALLEGFKDDPDAMFILWKDHTAVAEAQLINSTAANFDVNYLQYVGGTYSSEWFWAKILHTAHTNPAVKEAAFTWMEHSDWMPFLLTGGKLHELKRNICAAGHKALWSDAFSGFPPKDFFKAVDPYLGDLVQHMPGEFVTSDKAVGFLCGEWAQRLGLSTDVVIAAGIIDAHAGAIGAEIKPYEMVKIMGTSTCDILVVPPGDLEGKQVEGICGQVTGSVLSDMIGLEAGQSAFGDIFNWYASLLSWPLQQALKDGLQTETDETQKIPSKILQALSEQAAGLPLDRNAPMAVDWFNGRRTPHANQMLSASISKLSLGTDACVIYKSLVEGACYGAKKINDCFASQGITIKGITAIGGIAKKSPYILQTLANVLQLSIKVHNSEETCAIGAAINASLAAGIFANAATAVKHMGQGFTQEYFPDPQVEAYYKERIQLYEKAGEFMESICVPGAEKVSPVSFHQEAELVTSH